MGFAQNANGNTLLHTHIQLIALNAWFPSLPLLTEEGILILSSLVQKFQLKKAEECQTYCEP